MGAKFFGFLPGPPQFWTLSAAATQIAGAVLLSLGVFSRPTALAMSATMITAVIFHLLNTGPEAFPLGIPKAHSYNFELATSRARPIVAVSSLENTEQPEFITTLTDVGITALRLGTCALMVHHGFDKIQNVDGFSANVVAKFFGFLPGPPQFWTLSAAATQIAGAVLLSLGVFS